jgi:biopolymer transport protein TolR
MSRGARRRTISEINMVPFIDVMLVLLIIFMVTAPLISVGTVDLPTVGASRQRQEPHVVELVIAADASLRARVDGVDQGPIAAAAIGARVRELLAGNEQTPVLISADRSVRYEEVVKVMDAAQRAGVKRLGLMTKNTGAASPSANR